MQLQAVVDTAAQVTLVSEEFYKSLDPAPTIKPPYYPEKTLVSSLSAISNLGTLS
jgi:hypothetical protein